LRRKLNKIFSELLKKDRNDLVFWHELDKSKIKNNDDLRNVMEQQGMFHGDGLKRFKSSLKDISNDLYMEFVNSSEDDTHVDDSKVHERFNRFLLKICKVMCQKENRVILMEMKTIFKKILPGNQLENANARTFMELMKKRGIICYNDFDRLTSNIESILGKENYDKVIGYLVKEYETDMANGKIEENISAGSTKRDGTEEETFEYNVTMTTNNEGKLTLTENVTTESIDSSPKETIVESEQNVNEMEDVKNSSPASKKRCIPKNILEGRKINPEDLYSMASNPLGNCLIFNNYFENNADFSKRDGTEKDEEELVILFEWLQFSVKLFKNCSAEEIKQRLLLEATDGDNNNHDCLVVIILSHGFEGGVYGNDGKELTFNSITEIFDHCKALIGKPKIYIMQACQGNEDVVPVSRDQKPLPRPTYIRARTNQRPPMKSDQMLFVATPPGYVSYRVCEYGSWFIQDLCTVFKEHANKSSILTLAIKITNLMKKSDDRIENKEITAIPCIRDSTLCKELYFKPLGDFEEYKKSVAEGNVSMVLE